MKYGLSYTLITRVTTFLGRTILHWRKTELNYIVNLLKEKENIKILDFGCNTGYFLKIIKDKYPSAGFDLYGADINKYALKYARKKYPDFNFFEIDNDFFEKGKFDVVILSHVLEHIKERNEMVANLVKLFKKNGELIVAVPQERIRGDCSIPQLLYNFMRLRFENPHLAMINYYQLNDLLLNNVFQISNHTYTNFFYPFKSNNKKFYSWSLIVSALKRT